MQVPNGTGPGVRRSKCPLLASCTRCNVLCKPPKFGNKVKICIKVQFTEIEMTSLVIKKKKILYIVLLDLCIKMHNILTYKALGATA